MNSPQQKLQLEKIVHLGRCQDGEIFAKIKLTENGNLSISGVEGPRPGGNCKGSCGQIILHYKEYDKRGYTSIAEIDPAPGWTPALIKEFFDVWDRWHLNDMKSACEHQRELGWTYETHSDPKTFRGQLCPTCGYSIGSAWRKETIPQEVLTFLGKLPETNIQPAWV